MELFNTSGHVQSNKNMNVGYRGDKTWDFSQRLRVPCLSGQKEGFSLGYSDTGFLVNNSTCTNEELI